MIKKSTHSIPVYDICSLTQAGNSEHDIIAQPFAAYLKVHPNLHDAHRHNFYHVVLFTRGSGKHTVDFEQFDVQAGQIYFMIPGQVHSWQFEDDVDGYIINFSERLLQSFLADKDYPEQFNFFRGVARDGVINLPVQAAKEAALLFERIITETDGAMQYRYDVICLALASLFISVSRNSSASRGKPAQVQNQLVLSNFRKLVNTYYAEKRLPKEYAAMLYITPNHLNAMCNDLLGQPAGELIRERVLLEAKRLLVNREISISEIAYQLNFMDNSYFTKFFKKYTGITPEDFRKNPGAATNHQ